jgi:hypothetical protein
LHGGDANGPYQHSVPMTDFALVQTVVRLHVGLLQATKLKV